VSGKKFFLGDIFECYCLLLAQCWQNMLHKVRLKIGSKEIFTMCREQKLILKNLLQRDKILVSGKNFANSHLQI